MTLNTVAPRYRLRIKQRLVVIDYVVAYGVKAASRQFGLDRKTVRRWREQYRQAGIPGLVPRYPARPRPYVRSGEVGEGPSPGPPDPPSPRGARSPVHHPVWPGPVRTPVAGTKAIACRVRCAHTSDPSPQRLAR